MRRISDTPRSKGLDAGFYFATQYLSWEHSSFRSHRICARSNTGEITRFRECSISGRSAHWDNIVRAFVRDSRENRSVPFRDTVQISPGKTSSLHPRTRRIYLRGPYDDYGLRNHQLARPTARASYSVLVHRVAALLRASFRQSLATLPLRFANTSPPSDCIEDSHFRAAGHARLTKKKPG